MKRSITLLDGATGTNLWSMARQRGYSCEPAWLYNYKIGRAHV